MGCSALWTRRRRRSTGVLVRPEASRHPEAIDIGDYGPRSVDGSVRSNFGSSCGGTERRAAIREHVRLAELFAALVEVEPGWEVVAPHPFSTVCFRHVDRDNDEIAKAATATGEVFVATTKLRGDTIIRLAIGNERTTEADILRAWEVLRSSAA